jgi:hypothetical protein
MPRTSQPGRALWLDALLLTVTVAASAWLASRSQADVEKSLGLCNTRWLADMGRGFATKKEPKHSAWELCSRFQRRALPPFFLLSAGLGLIALRRPRPAGLHRRWGPGRVAAALGVLLPSISIAEEYVLRRFNFMSRGDYHDTLFGAWQRFAPSVGIAIAAAWTILALLGRWKLWRAWREWLGLLLGVIWIVNLLWVALLQPLGN